MPYQGTGRVQATATVTSKGQITLPVELRRRWGIKSGDRIDFILESENRVVVRKRIRRSIFESRDELPPLTLGRPSTQRDIDDAMTAEMDDQERRVRERSET